MSLKLNPSLFNGQPTLESFQAGRDNNFNLLRFVAATIVIFSHCLPLSRRPDHINQIHTPGILAVYAFFVMSGFLITQSWLKRPSLRSFLVARAARVLPALWISVLGSVVLGMVFTTLSTPAFLDHPLTAKFIVRNLTQFAGFAAVLPDVFARNPFPYVINGSLWTLQYELILYLGVALLGTLAILGDLRNSAKIFGLCIIGYLFCKGWGQLNFTWFLQGSGLNAGLWLELSSYFVLGSVAQIFRRYIPLTWPLTLASVVAAGLLLFIDPGEMWLKPFLAYAVLAAAFLPGGAIRGFNQLGDFSYGLYIYAFPVQQTLMAMYLAGHPDLVQQRGVPVWEMTPFFLGSFGITLALAMLSWFFLEKPCIKLGAALR